jgi:hypothetical protein
MRTLVILFILLVATVVGLPQSRNPKFSDHPVSLYHGKIHKPRWIRHVKGGEWRDEGNKLVDEPSVNFAGKYFVAGHSLGADAQYYSLTDLSTGRELDVLSPFATAEPIPTLKDGREYQTVIYSRPNSRLLIAQYLIDYMSTPKPQCRERSFVFQNGKIRPVTKLSFKCRKLSL